MGVPMTLVYDPLMELAGITSVFIKQDISLFEVFTGCETKNRFHVYAKTQYGYKYLFKCREESSWCERNCLTGSCRPYRMKVKHIKAVDQFNGDFGNQEIYADFQRNFKCTCMCIQRPNLKASKYNGEYLGRINFPYTCCDPVYEVCDRMNNLRYIVTGDCCQCGLMCRKSYGMCSEVLFDIKKPGQDIKVGTIRKVFSGFIQEMLTDADNFELVFPQDATPEDKLMLIGNVLMIDYSFFENEKKKVTPQKTLLNSGLNLF
jgi:hypothetical protein